MKNNKYFFLWRGSRDYGVMDIPMMLLIITIISALALSLFVASQEAFVSTYKREQFQTTIADVYDMVSTMSRFSTEESQIQMTLSFPSIVDTIIFGSDTFSIEDVGINSSNLSYHSRTAVIYRLTTGEVNIVYFPLAFSDVNKDPLVLRSGTYSILFQLQKQDNEVFVIGTIL